MKLLSCITYECMDIVYKIFRYVNSVSRLCLHLRDAASVMIELGLEVEALEEPLYVSSPLGIKARIGMICRGCELEISGTLLTVDLRIMDMSEFDVILGMDWLTAYRVVIDYERRRVISYRRTVLVLCFRGTSMLFCPRQCTSPGVRDSWQVG